MPESKLRRAHPDYILMLAVAGLVIIGLMMVYSATFDWSYQKYGSSFRIASRQFLWVGLGLIALMVMAGIPYDWWQRVAVPVMGVALLLLVLVLFVGDERFGARRSFFGGSVQPGELAKLATAIYVAAWLASKGDQIRDVTYGLVPFPFQLAIGGIVSGITFLVLINQLPYARQRIDEYLQIWRDPTRVGYHIQQALIALGSGGLFGVGLGQGQEKLGYLPAAHTDSIFAVLGEELGFVGCLVVVGLFVLLAYRGFKIALEASEPFAALLACGITCWLTFQALINVAVMTGLLPFTGIALPFISSGGSAMVVSLAGVGLLLSVSRGRRVGKQVRKGERRRAHLDRRWGNRGTRLSRSGRRAGAGR